MALLYPQTPTFGRLRARSAMSCLALAGDLLPQLTLMTQHGPHRGPAGHAWATPVRQPLPLIQKPDAAPSGTM